MEIIKIENIKKEMNKVDNQWRKYQKGEITASEYAKDIYERQGFKNRREYLDNLAKKRHYKDYKEYKNEFERQSGYKKGLHEPMNENVNCPLYLGVYIGENILAKIFKNVQKMPFGNKGYDFICDKGYKVDMKTVCLSNKQWIFVIRENKITDYFLLMGFDDRVNLNIIHVWLIKGNEIIRGRKLNEYNALNISFGMKSVKKFSRYEITNKLNDIKILCENFKEERKIKEKDDINNKKEIKEQPKKKWKIKNP